MYLIVFVVPYAVLMLLTFTVSFNLQHSTSTFCVSGELVFLFVWRHSKMIELVAVSMMVAMMTIILMILTVYDTEQIICVCEIPYCCVTDGLKSPPDTEHRGFCLIAPNSSSTQTVCLHLSSGHNRNCTSHSGHLHLIVIGTLSLYFQFFSFL
jgi:hypothetical protein